MAKKLVTIFFVLIVSSSLSQEYFTKNKVYKQKITQSQLKSNADGIRIFQLLGLENNIDAGRIYLSLKYRVLLNITRNEDNRLILKINLSKISIDGHINIKDFAIDSLLWPGNFTATIELINGRHKRDILNIVGDAFNKTTTVDLTENYSPGIGELNAIIKDIGFSYSNKNLLAIEEISQRIKYYYSYSTLIDNVISEYDKKAFAVGEAHHDVILRKLELDRLFYNLTNHKLTESLILKNRDPSGLLRKEKALKRLGKRAQTLYNNVLRNSTSDPESYHQFCKGYCNLSKKYLSQSKSHQPSYAIGFNEMAQVVINGQIRKNLTTITNYYLSNEADENLLYNYIFSEFTDLADYEIKNENFADALLLLSNSNTIKNWFNLSPTKLFVSSSIAALAGISTSYLKVGKMALTAGNLSLSYKYIGKCESVIDQNSKIIQSVAINDTSFNEFIRLQIGISQKLSELEEYAMALKSLMYASSICKRTINTTLCVKVDSLICHIHINKQHFEIEQLIDLLNRYQYPDAYNMLFAIKRNMDTVQCSDEKVKALFNENTYSLFLEYLQQGQILSDAKQYGTALEKLLKARSLKNILKITEINIDSLIKIAAEPVIQKIIEQSNFDTWANRIDDANLLYDSAINLNLKYYNGKNERIKHALNELQINMELRKCVEYRNNYNDAIRNAHILIKKNKYENIEKHLLEADYFAKNFPECNINNSDVKKIKSQHQFKLEFYRLYSNLRNQLYQKEYENVIMHYKELMRYYNLHNLQSKGILFPTLNEFIVKQKLPVLTLETAKYYLNENKPEHCLKYLSVYKEQGGKKQDCKNVMSENAIILAKLDNEVQIPVKEALNKYTQGESWYNHFKIVYIKNRYIKLKR
jgi:hypothetical protein